jgi:UDP-N-acetylglucosamine--N-acetylmuramyl-(pentapeptide) pyrophosphoryl-undecaprenol N-acetylglucosamine transferase
MFIPYPYAAGDHQYHNAKFLEEQSVAWIMREKEIDDNKIINIIDNEDIKSISYKLQNLIEKDGALEIAELLKGNFEEMG